MPELVYPTDRVNHQYQLRGHRGTEKLNDEHDLLRIHSQDTGLCRYRDREVEQLRDIQLHALEGKD